MKIVVSQCIQYSKNLYKNLIHHVYERRRLVNHTVNLLIRKVTWYYEVNLDDEI